MFAGAAQGRRADAPGSVRAAPAQTILKVEGPLASKPIPSGFIGLSLEYSAIVPYGAVDSRSINPVLVNLIRNLAPGQSPVLRIGGDTTDWSWWPIQGMRPPLGIRYSITPNWVAGARGLAEATNARLILGINLEAGSTTIAATEARALLRGLSRRYVLAFEIGNEPELYGVRPWRNPPGGPVVPGRPPDYDFGAFLSEFKRYRRLLPTLPVAGPAVGGDLVWMNRLPLFLAAQPKVGFVTFHRYALNSCITDPSSPYYPSVPHLLTRFASRGLMSGISQLVDVAHRHGDQFRIDELNSVTCGGKLGVSNTFGAALWMLDALFTMARDGVDGVNIHTFPRGLGELFDFARLHGRWQTTTVRPAYYGALMFAQAAPPGSRLLRVIGSPSGLLRSWATRSPDGRVRVVLINASMTHAFSTRLQIPTESSPATIERLQAPSAYATSMVKIGGRTFAPRTTSGKLGPPRTTLSRPSATGYTVEMPPASAALITVPSGR
jgi:hypothetical protein